jgi:hypothetical protein
LQSIQCPKPQIKSVPFDQALSSRKFGLSYGEDFDLLRNDVFAKLPEEEQGVLSIDEFGSNLDRKDGGQFDDSQA